MKKLHSIHPPASDAKFVGDEPTWHDMVVDDLNYVKQMMRGLNWHNYVAKDTNYHKYLVEWVSRHFPEKLASLESVNASQITPTIAAIARMHLQGFPLKERHLTSIVDHIKELTSPKVKPVQKKTHPLHQPNVQDSMRQQVSGTLSDIDAEIDTAFDTFEIDPPKITDLILRKQYGSKHLSIICKHIDVNLQEWNSAYNKEDDQLTQAYSFVPRRRFKVIIDGFSEVLQKVRHYSDGLKTPRKPRPLNKASVTKNLKFLKEFEVYKGEAATEVVGATILWIYDTKYRKLIRMEGEKKGLSVKGSSIVGVVKAESRTLRWPERQLQEFVAKGKKSKEWFADLTTKPTEASHRITSSMILLRVE